MQISGRKVDSELNTPLQLSAFYGKQALERINDYRKSRILPPLQWSDSLHLLAFEHSTKMSDGSVSIGHDGMNARFEELVKQQGQVISMAENIALVFAAPLLTAIDKMILQWTS